MPIMKDCQDKVILFGIPIDNLSMEETLDRIEAMVRDGAIHQHVVINVDKVVKLARDEKLRKIVLDCDLINADGQPVVWASRILQQPLKERVTGIDLFDGLMKRCAERGFRIYLVGAREEVIAHAVEVLKSRHPSLQLAGWRNGYWSAAEERHVVEEIKKARPDVLCVAMGTPKQEFFLAGWKHEMQVPFVMGVGGSFDVVAGVVKRAPVWMQRCGLEWLCRLAQEPRRLWRRYLIEDMAFFRLLLREWLAKRKS